MTKNKVYAAIFVILLLLIPIQTLLSMRHESLNGDEAHQITSGYSKLKTYDFRLLPEHGPLIHVISAFPLLFFHVNFPFDDASWKIKNLDLLTYKFFFEYGNDPYFLAFWARIPMILLSVLLGIYVYIWAKKLYGINAGLLALFLYTFSPDMLAHSQITSSDFGLAVFVFISLYYFWRFVNSPTWMSMVIAGFTLGLAQISKFSAIFLFPIYILIALVIIFSNRKSWTALNIKVPSALKTDTAKKFYRYACSLLLIFFVTYLVIILAYRTEGMLKPIATSMSEDVHLNKTLYPLESFTGSSNIKAFLLEQVPSPLPYYYVRGLGYSFYMSNESVPSYVVNGQARVVWYFFILSFLVKTPIGLLLMLFIALIFYYKLKGKFLDECFLLMPFIIFQLAFMFTTKQFGYRYLLPTLPFLFVFASRITAYKFEWDKLFKIIITGLSLWYLVSSLMIYPHYLSYFNEFIGPENGYRHFVDSNVDWGQDLFYLRDYLHENNITGSKISYYGFPVVHGFKLPPYYNISYTKLGCGQTEGIIAISVTNLMRDNACYGWLQNKTPIKRIGYSMIVYNITESG